MKKIPHRDRKVDYLIRRGRSPDGIPFVKEIDERAAARLRISVPRFASWSHADIIQYMTLEVHHVIPDTDDNVRLMPDYIHCLLNLRLLHKGYHGDHKFHDAIPIEIGIRRQKKLERNPRTRLFLNEVR